MNKDTIVVKVYKNKSNNQLLINVPKKSGIKEGSYVRIINLYIEKDIYGLGE